MSGFAVVSAFSGAAGASAPNGLSATDRLLDLADADSFGRWSLVASASRKSWQDEPFASRFVGIVRTPATAQASNGESRRASVSFDWQRWLAAGSLRAGAFATARETAVNAGGFADADSTLWERVGQQDRGTRIGMHRTWQGFRSTVRLRLQGESLEAQGRLDRTNGEAPRLYIDDRLRQSFTGLDLGTSFRPLPRLFVSTAMEIERHRFAVASSRGLDSAGAAGTQLSPRLELSATPRGGNEYFASFGRGTRAMHEHGPGVAIDPRDGTPLARIDPVSAATVAEAGWRSHWGGGTETRLAAWQAKTVAELMLVAEGGVLPIDRPAVRNGITFSARHQPAPWLSLDLEATALEARYRDGTREKVRGAAERQVNAGATVRNGSKWSASLFVKYLGDRTSVEEDALRLRSSTTVGAQLTTRISKVTRVTVDVFNVFNQRNDEVDYFAASRLWTAPGTVEGYLFHPAAPRGFRILLTTRF